MEAICEHGPLLRLASDLYGRPHMVFHGLKWAAQGQNGNIDQAPKYRESRVVRYDSDWVGELELESSGRAPVREVG